MVATPSIPTYLINTFYVLIIFMLIDPSPPTMVYQDSHLVYPDSYLVYERQFRLLYNNITES